MPQPTRKKKQEFTSAPVSHNHDPIHPGLLSLLTYALQHRHSAQWVSAILAILSREGVARG
jgi:hypothetical protein